MAKRPTTTTAERGLSAQGGTTVLDAPPTDTQAMVPATRRRPLVDDGPPPVGSRQDLKYEPLPPAGGVRSDATDEPDVEQWARNETYTGLSERPVSAEQAKALLEPVRDDELLIKPDQFGAVYLSHPGYRRRLNAAFKPAGWGLRRLSPYNFDEKDGMLYAEYGLYAEGRFLAAATGEQKWLGADGTNDKMTKGDAIEGCRSNALMRCCKDLGMAMECWDKDFTERWRNTYCVRVWKNNKPAWRRLIDPPQFGETGVMDDSPNRDKYTQPPQARGQARGGSSQPAATAPASNGQQATGDQRKGNPTTLINEKQKKFFWTVVKQQNLDADDVAEYLKKTFKITKSEEMTNEMLDQALAWVRDPDGR
jgi:hypothetical protein